jgi:hypothetical protein
MTERDEEFETWPAAPDPIRTALSPMIEHIFAVTVDGSPERAASRDRVDRGGRRGCPRLLRIYGHHAGAMCTGSGEASRAGSGKQGPQAVFR